MGAAAGRLKKSKHKDKVKQTVDLFRSGAYSTQNADKWIEQHICLRIKLTATGQHLPNKISKGSLEFIEYYKQFSGSSNSLQFKQLVDVKFLEQVFQLFTFRCTLNGKYKINGEIWIKVETGQIYQFAIEQQVKGGMTYLDVMRATNPQQYKCKQMPRQKPRYQPSTKTANNNDDFYIKEKEKQFQRNMGIYYQQRKQGTFGGTYWR